MKTLNDLLSSPGTTYAAVRDHLGSLSPRARVEQSLSLDRSNQPKLWRLAAGTAPITAEDIVPASKPDFEPVPFFGQNNQPLFQLFRKVFFRLPDGTIGGYNESPVAPLVGPGYYTVGFGKDGAFVDYTRVPREAPIGWPEVTINERGLSHIVYGHMQDDLRRVHDRVWIGHARKFGKDTPHYFVLARPD